MVETNESKLAKATKANIESVTESYLSDTPRKLRELRQGLIPSAITKPMSKAVLAELTEVGAQNVGKIEKDYNETHSLNPSIKYLIKIALIFDVDMNYLVGLTDEPRRLNVNTPLVKTPNPEKINEYRDNLQLHKDMIEQQRKTIVLLEEKVKVS